MTKQTGTIITIVAAILTFLCCTIPLCIGSILIFTGVGTWSTELGPGGRRGAIPPAFGIAPLCLSILVWVVPLLLWLFLVRNKEDEAAIPTPDSSSTED
ncbi:MAG: hypothetical protein DRI79_14625 [Chloroflexi bacterium]|nr:MAG: hypothetical protein DRI80_02555 [Chloroflexota bacterium]RLC82578.1 MAG: hypothetical protein DRI79_14625 [Chloroflexota bacterium]